MLARSRQGFAADVRRCAANQPRGWLLRHVPELLVRMRYRSTCMTVIMPDSRCSEM